MWGLIIKSVQLMISSFDMVRSSASAVIDFFLGKKDEKKGKRLATAEDFMEMIVISRVDYGKYVLSQRGQADL